MTPLFSTAFMPPIAYMATLAKYPEAHIEAKETFPKQTYRNRLEIMTANGVKTLTVPVIRNNHSRTDEVRIDYKERWNIIHFRTLEAAYSASPYYLYYKDGLENLLMQRYDLLLQLNLATLEWLLKQLKTPCTVTLTTDFLPFSDNPLDYRNTFSPKHPYPTEKFPRYYQVFDDRQPFAPNLSILDLLFNLGPEAKQYLSQI